MEGRSWLPLRRHAAALPGDGFVALVGMRCWAGSIWQRAMSLVGCFVIGAGFQQAGVDGAREVLVGRAGQWGRTA